MQHVVRNLSATGPGLNLSPEFWLADVAASSLSTGTPFSEFVRLSKKTATPSAETPYILDTSSAREGFLQLPIIGDGVTSRSSIKKLVEEGDLLISRLRPYLRQVMYIPKGTFRLLGVERLYCSTEFHVFQPRSEVCIAGLVGWLLSHPIQEMVQEAATGGHHPRFNAELLLSAPVSKEFVDESYSASVSALLFQQIKNQIELATLLGHGPSSRVAA